MKKALLTLMLLVACTSLSAQITKTAMEMFASKAGTSWANIQTLYVGNDISVFEDGSMKRSTKVFGSDRGHVYTPAETGLMVTTKEGTPDAACRFYPYARIRTVEVFQKMVIITLED